jgi:hypothetical protein
LCSRLRRRTVPGLESPGRSVDAEGATLNLARIPPMSAVPAAVAAVPKAITAPAKTAKSHPYVVFAVIIALTILAVVLIEAKRPGTFSRGVQKAFRWIPGVGPKLAAAAGG